MWKRKRGKDGGGKGGRQTRRSSEADPEVEDDDHEEESGLWRVEHFPQHAGCISLEQVKASPEFADRIVFPADAPKRKYGVCFGYLGSSYQGLQINPGAVTVEAVLEKALFLSGGIEECNYENLQKVGWTRAARTDRGVHAIAQVWYLHSHSPRQSLAVLALRHEAEDAVGSGDRVQRKCQSIPTCGHSNL